MKDSSRKLILLVDDSQDDELLTIDALRNGGISSAIAVVRDGAEALDWFFGKGAHAQRDLNVMPDVVLLDLKLPKVGGLEVLVRMRADRRTRFIPTVVLSSSTQSEDIINSYRNGANSYLRKAMDFEQFTGALQCLGKYWLQYNQAPMPV